MRILVVMALVVSSLAAAQPQKPEVMSLPLSLRRVPAGVTADDKERLQREFTRQLKLAGASVPEFTKSEAALKDVKGKDCAREDACLTQVAKRAGVLYGLFASLDVTVEGTLVATARVVRDDGEVVRPLVSVTKARGGQSYLEVAKQLIGELMTRLAPGSLPVQRAAAVAVVPVAPPPIVIVEPPASKPEPPPSPAPRVQQPTVPPRSSTAGWVVLASGAGVAVAGAIVGLIGFGAGTSVPRTMGVLDRAEDAGKLRQAGLFATLGLAGVGVGAAGALIGVLLLGTSSPSASLWLTGDGGAVVTFGGSL